jgi:F-type H+-transporting ATPase subunit c
VSTVLRVVILAAVVLGTLATPTMAQGPAPAGQGWQLISISGALGAAITIIGAGYGIGRLASSAVESMARQPEVAGNIQTAMIIAAALIEGVTFFALIICIIKG